MSKLEEKLLAYVLRFGDNFPVYAMRGAEDTEIIDAIDGCLLSDKPFVAGYEDDVCY